MDGTVLYELRFHFHPAYAAAVIGGLGLLAVFVWEGCKMVQKERREKGRANRSTVVVAAFLLLWEAVGIYGFVVRPALDYWRARDAYEKGQTLTVEGPVEDFQLRQDFFVYYETFTIDGVAFSSWPKVYGSGLPGYPMQFNWLERTQRGGGLIRDGQRLRIRYVTFPGRGGAGEDYHCIVLIEEYPIHVEDLP